MGTVAIFVLTALSTGFGMLVVGPLLMCVWEYREDIKEYFRKKKKNRGRNNV